ncbi:MAG: lytic polysaccharide monooxygenase [Candidatus Binatia bacterium]|nr:lytic polysaccharide monooxygenase [Candidatus Binatia bacterium]
MKSNRRWTPMMLTAALAAAVTLPANAFAHGYLSSPASRALLCKDGVNRDCGSVQYEPQSVEGAQGFPLGGPPDGSIASAGLSTFSPLDIQTPTRWHKQDIRSGPNLFSWRFTANHVTRDWRYYITQDDWDWAQPLTRDAFDLTPFCVVDGGMVRPPMTVEHACTVPPRVGNHVILGVWDVGDTAAAFYNVIDVQFGDGAGMLPDPETPSFREVGTIAPSTDLRPGDMVATRAFDGSGERADLATTLTIDTEAGGAAASWPRSLAARVNIEQSDLRAGAPAEGGAFLPVFGANTIQALESSGVTRVEVQITQATPEFASQITLDLPGEEVELAAGRGTVVFDLTVVGDLNVVTTLHDHAGNAVARDESRISDETKTITLVVDGAQAGHHTVVTYGTSLEGAETVQETANVFFVDVPAPVALEGCGGIDGAEAPVWDAATVYTAQDPVCHEGLLWAARWWTRGEIPGSADVWDLQSDVIRPWNDAVAYQGGEQATVDDRVYEARWWTRGDRPQDGGVWTEIVTVAP